MTQVPEPTPGLDAQLDQLLDAALSSQPSGSGSLTRLEALLAAAAAPAAGPQPGEEQALAAFRELVVEAAGTPSLAARRRRRQVSVAAIASTVVLFGSGVAAAANGSLPRAAQTTAKTVLGTLGVHVPGPNVHAGRHPDQRGSSGDDPGDNGVEPTPPSHPSHPAMPVTPANTGTPPTPGNSGAARHHGNPTPHASGHPAPQHGRPSAAPTVSRRHVPTASRAFFSLRVMPAARRAITR